MEREPVTTSRTVRDEPATETVVREEYRDVDRGMDVHAAAAGAIARDPITWGPIWAGVLTAFGLFLLLSLVALAGGLALVEVNGAGQPAQDLPVDLIGSIVTGLFLVVAFFAGGFAASWSGGLVDEGRGIFHGFLVWALAMVLLLLFAALGIGQIFGTAGQIFAGLGPGAVPDPNVDPQQLTEALQTAAWQTTFAIVLALASAVLGGFVGTMDQVQRRWSDYTSRFYTTRARR